MTFDTDSVRINILRPQRLMDFMGQEKALDNLRVFINAASNRCEALDHVLLHGPPGLGKTTLAQIISNELNTNFKATSAPVITKAGDLAALLTNLQPNDVLFIDEIHRLNSAVEEILYSAMEDFHLDIMIGEGPSAKSVRIDLPPFTLVGATTRAGLMTKPLRDRFGIPVRLNYYDENSIAMVLMAQADNYGLILIDAAAHEIARRSRGTPRVAGNLLKRVRDFATVQKVKAINEELVVDALDKLGIDKLGLNSQDRKYMASMKNFYNGGPVGIETMAACLSDARDTIEDIIEPYLLQKGLLQRTPKGRQLTDAGLEHLILPHAA